MAKNIFIGGTGRSGTTVLAKTLGMSSQVYTFPFELRFHVDSDGLSSLWRAGSLNYNPPVSGARLKSFLHLMKRNMVEPGRQPYRNFELPRFFGTEKYNRAVDCLISQICLDHYVGFQLYAEPNRQISENSHLARAISRRLIRAYGRVFDRTTYTVMKGHGYEYAADIFELRYFDDSDILARMLGSFFEKLAVDLIAEKGAAVFCEHTPGNACEAPFIARAMPNSCMVWISRNPADVALSYRDQAWAPKAIKSICEMLKAQYSVWQRNKIELDKLGYSYIEISIEDLTRNPVAVISDIFTLAGIESEIPDTTHLNMDRHSGRRYPTATEKFIIDSFFPGTV